MDRLFRIDFYPQDWIAKTGDLTPEECGVYIQIVAMIYAHRGPIIYDADTLSRKLKGCSIRLLKSTVQRLIEKEKITFQDGKIGQRRAESELNSKRTHLELSAKGGRNKHENETQSNKNNDIASSDTQISVASTTPSPPHPLIGKKDTPLPPKSPHRGKGEGFKKIGDLVGGQEGGGFDIEKFLQPEDFREMIKILPLWDRNLLMRRYNVWIEKKGRPDHPRAAFNAWMKKQPQNP